MSTHPMPDVVPDIDGVMVVCPFCEGENRWGSATQIEPDDETIGEFAASSILTLLPQFFEHLTTTHPHLTTPAPSMIRKVQL